MAPAKSTLLAMTGAFAALSLGSSSATPPTIDQKATVLSIANGELEGFGNFVLAIAELGDEGLGVLSAVCQAEVGSTVLVPSDAALPLAAVQSIGARSLSSFVMSHVVVAELTDATLPDDASAEYMTLAPYTSVNSGTIKADLVGIDMASFYNLTDVLPVTVETLFNGYLTQSGLSKWVTSGVVLSDGLVAALTAERMEGDAAVTAFVPNAAAFNGLFRAYPDLLIEPIADSTNTLSTVLGGHVVDGADAALPDDVVASGEFFPMQTAGVMYKGITSVIGADGLSAEAVTKFGGLVNFVAGVDMLTTLTSLIAQDVNSTGFMDYTGTGENVLVEIARAYAATKVGNDALTGRVVFAPTNAAFAELPANLIKGLTTVKHNFPMLFSILKEHVAFSEEQIMEGTEFNVTNLNGREIMVDNNTEMVSIGDMEVATAIDALVSGDDDISVLRDTAIIVDKVILPVFEAPMLLESIMDVVNGSEVHTVLKFVIETLELEETLSNVFDDGIAPVLLAPTDAAFIAWAKTTLDAEFTDAAAMIAALPGVLASDPTIPALVQNLLLDHVVNDVTDYNAAFMPNGLVGCGVENEVMEVGTMGPNKLKLMYMTDNKSKLVKQTMVTADITVGDGIQRLNGYVVVLSSVLDTFGMTGATTSAPTSTATVAPTPSTAAPIRSLEAAWLLFASLALCVGVSA